MNINNYESITNEIIGSYISNVRTSDKKVLNKIKEQVEITLKDLKELEKNNPTYKQEIDIRINQLDNINQELKDKINNNKKNKFNQFKRNVGSKVTTARKYMNRAHRMTEAPVDYVKRSIGLK